MALLYTIRIGEAYKTLYPICVGARAPATRLFKRDDIKVITSSVLRKLIMQGANGIRSYVFNDISNSWFEAEISNFASYDYGFFRDRVRNSMAMGMRVRTRRFCKHEDVNDIVASQYRPKCRLCHKRPAHGAFGYAYAVYLEKAGDVASGNYCRVCYKGPRPKYVTEESEEFLVWVLKKQIKLKEKASE